MRTYVHSQRWEVGDREKTNIIKLVIESTLIKNPKNWIPYLLDLGVCLIVAYTHTHTQTDTHILWFNILDRFSIANKLKLNFSRQFSWSAILWIAWTFTFISSRSIKSETLTRALCAAWFSAAVVLFYFILFCFSLFPIKLMHRIAGLYTKTNSDKMIMNNSQNE